MSISFLHEIQAKARTRALELITELRATEDDGRIKLFLIYMALKARKEHSDLFEKGAYAPLKVSGRLRDHLIAFSRNHGTTWALTIAPRFLTGLVKEGEYPLGHKVWADTSIHLPEGAPSLWKDAITQQGVKGQGTLLAGEVMRHFPVAMLTGKEDT